MALMPGATIRLIPRHNGGTRRPKGRGTSFHVTASGARSMYGYFSTVGDCSHFHVAKDGEIEQYIDTDFRGAAQRDGDDMVTVETQGAAPGVNAETEKWTPQQVESNARIAKWVHDTEGAPLVLMPDSRTKSRGVGYHRLGIDPWRVADGEVWSRTRGKVCPGTAKIAQIPEIIARAIQLGAPKSTATTAASKPTEQEDDMNADDRRLLQETRDLAQGAYDMAWQMTHQFGGDYDGKTRKTTWGVLTEFGGKAGGSDQGTIVKALLRIIAKLGA
jgi:hypothetical protein